MGRQYNRIPLLLALCVQLLLLISCSGVAEDSSKPEDPSVTEEVVGGKSDAEAFVKTRLELANNGVRNAVFITDKDFRFLQNALCESIGAWRSGERAFDFLNSHADLNGLSVTFDLSDSELIETAVKSNLCELNHE